MNFRLVSKMLAIVALLIGVTMVFSLPWALPSMGWRRDLPRPEVFEQSGFIGLVGSLVVSFLVAGMLFWSGPKNAAKNLIESDDARNLLGTIYLPAAQLEIIANNTIADKSAYTVIVAKKLTLDAGPNLVLNTNYSGTDIPVPNGVGPTGSGVFLSQ